MTGKIYILASVPTSPILTDQQKTEITAYINNLRAKHQSPNLQWDDTICAFSQQWANYLLTNSLFQHSGSPLYGENLAYFQGFGIDVMTLLKKAVDSWYNEIALYDFNNPGFSEKTGHFTCLVWKSSLKYGISISIDPTTETVVISMNTLPPGNYTNEYVQNVLRLNEPLPVIPVIPVTPIVVTPSVPTVVKPNSGSVKIMAVTELLKIINDLNTFKAKKDIINRIHDLISKILRT